MVWTLNNIWFHSFLQLEDIEVHAVQLPIGSTYLRCKSYNPQDINTLVVNFYEVGPISIQNGALLDLLLTIAEEPLFDILRTKEQLGYDVSCKARDNQGVLGYTISINSQENTFDVDYIDEHIENFRKELLGIIKNLSSDDFGQFKESLITTKMAEDVDMVDEVARNWGEICSDEYVFDRAQREAEALRAITEKDLLAFYLETYGEKARKLATQVIGNAGGNKNGDDITVNDNSNFDHIQIVEIQEKNTGRLIKDIAEFKKSLKVYPVCRTSVNPEEIWEEGICFVN